MSQGTEGSSFVTGRKLLSISQELPQKEAEEKTPPKTDPLPTDSADPFEDPEDPLGPDLVIFYFTDSKDPFYKKSEPSDGNKKRE